MYRNKFISNTHSWRLNFWVKYVYFCHNTYFQIILQWDHTNLHFYQPWTWIAGPSLMQCMLPLLFLFLHFAFWKVKICVIIANFIFKLDTRMNLCHIFMHHLYFVFLELHLYVLYSIFNWVLGLILSIPWNALCVCVCSVMSSSLWSYGL